MSRNILGVIGGVLIALSVFFSGDTATFSSGALSDTFSLVLFLAGVAVIVFLLLRNRTWAAYSAIAATTLALIVVIDMLRAGSLDLAIGFILLVVGVILALFATVTGSTRR